MSQQINLFNPIFLKQKKIFSSVTMVQALLAVLVGGMVLVAYGRHHVEGLEREAVTARAVLAQKEARKALVDTEFAPRKPARELESDIVEAEAQLAALKSVAGVLSRGDMGASAGYAEHYKALARQHMDGLWLTGVTVAGLDVGIRGRARNASLVPGYIKRLTREPVLQGKTFASLQIAQGQDKDEGGKPQAAPYIEFRLDSLIQEEAK